MTYRPREDPCRTAPRARRPGGSGTYLNGFHERRELSYPEDGYGFPEHSDTVVSAPNAALVRLWVGGEPLDRCGSR
ncbi:hypothetical protein [Micromonospora fulviviridis]|uniref:hypothetical protein n=1 Tax=Micromonospora fulviviridis TaxID=47860 RepID=UPI001E59EFB4|nr:hypothetical protein [Micromonospora fulviviridis]